MKLSSILVGALILCGALYFLYPAVFGNIFPDSVAGQMILTYADGSTKTVNGGTSLAVAQAGSSAAITSVRWVVKATTNWQDTSISTISGASWTCFATVSVDGVVKQTVSTPQNPPTSISRGGQYTILTWDVSGATLNGWVPFDYKSHAVTFSTDVTYTFTPPSSTATTISGNAAGNLSLQNIGFPATLTVTGTATVS